MQLAFWLVYSSFIIKLIVTFHFAKKDLKKIYLFIENTFFNRKKDNIRDFILEKNDSYEICEKIYLFFQKFPKEIHLIDDF